MPRKLKVFRTPTGFHDAYVAAPSRKAALAAWGSDADLFARGVAEEVTDPQLTAEPLRRPGEVIRVSRGDLAAQLKALGPRKKKPSSKGGAETAASAASAFDQKGGARTKRQPRAPRPPPSRQKVDAAELALTKARKDQAAEIDALEHERKALDRRIAALRARHQRELQRLERARDKAKETYQAALDRWSD